jgi:hypothetical protein
MSQEDGLISQAEAELLANTQDKGLGSRVVESATTGVGEGIWGAIKGGLAGVGLTGAAGAVVGAGIALGMAAAMSTPFGWPVVAAMAAAGTITSVFAVASFGGGAALWGAGVGGGLSAIKGIFGANNEINEHNQENQMIREAVIENIKAREFQREAGNEQNVVANLDAATQQAIMQARMNAPQLQGGGVEVSSPQLAAGAGVGMGGQGYSPPPR